MQHFLDAVDWFSVKFTLGVSSLCFITGQSLLMWLGGISVASNIIYNGIRIYKEIKNKK